MSDNIEDMYKRAREAFREIESWPQEKVDEMVAAAGWEWQKPETAQALARLAVDESNIGVYEDKVHKIGNKIRGTLRDQRGVQTCGLVKEDKEKRTENLCEADRCGSHYCSLYQSGVNRLLPWSESAQDEKCDDRIAASENQGKHLPHGGARKKGTGQGRRTGRSDAVFEGTEP